MNLRLRLRCKPEAQPHEYKEGDGKAEPFRTDGAKGASQSRQDVCAPSGVSEVFAQRLEAAAIRYEQS